MVFACVAFSVALYGASLTHGTGDWCVFCWSFSFVGTLLIILVKCLACRLAPPVSWKNFSDHTFACYASPPFLCLSASIIFPLYFLKGYAGSQRDDQTAALRLPYFLALATIAYLSEVSLRRARPGEVAGYMATATWAAKGCETFVACIIFVFISEPVSYNQKCSDQLVPGCVLHLLHLVGCHYRDVCRRVHWLPCPSPSPASCPHTPFWLWPCICLPPSSGPFISLTISMEARATDPTTVAPAPACVHGTSCWPSRSSALSNFILYLADLIYSARLVFVTA